MVQSYKKKTNLIVLGTRLHGMCGWYGHFLIVGGREFSYLCHKNYACEAAFLMKVKNDASRIKLWTFSVVYGHKWCYLCIRKNKGIRKSCDEGSR